MDVHIGTSYIIFDLILFKTSFDLSSENTLVSVRVKSYIFIKLKFTFDILCETTSDEKALRF